jgi:ABC-type lipoprotein release transport system permease subunit
MSKNKVNAKREAYAKKQEEQGKKVVTWIFGGLIIVAVIYLIWTLSMMS